MPSKPPPGMSRKKVRWPRTKAVVEAEQREVALNLLNELVGLVGHLRKIADYLAREAEKGGK